MNKQLFDDNAQAASARFRIRTGRPATFTSGFGGGIDELGRRGQHGLSLIELMVALVLGLLLLGGLVQMMVSNKQTYTFQQSQAANQENSRFSYLFFENFTMKAGFRNSPQDDLGATFSAVVANTNCAAFNIGQIITSNLKKGSGGTALPGYCLRYQRTTDTATETDCSGNAIANTNAFVTQVYVDTDAKRLMCAAQGAAAVPLVDNIENLSISYAVMSGGNLAYVTTPLDWTKVVAVRLAVLTASTTQVLDKAQTYKFPPDSATTTTATDRRAYRASQKTVFIRNSVLE